jgi:hypothetical protein
MASFFLLIGLVVGVFCTERGGDECVFVSSETSNGMNGSRAYPFSSLSEAFKSQENGSLEAFTICILPGRYEWPEEDKFINIRRNSERFSKITTVKLIGLGPTVFAGVTFVSFENFPNISILNLNGTGIRFEIVTIKNLTIQNVNFTAITIREVDNATLTDIHCENECFLMASDSHNLYISNMSWLNGIGSFFVASRLDLLLMDNIRYERNMGGLWHMDAVKQKHIHNSHFNHNVLFHLPRPLLLNVNISNSVFFNNSIECVEKRFQTMYPTQRVCYSDKRLLYSLIGFWEVGQENWFQDPPVYHVSNSIFSNNRNLMPGKSTIFISVPNVTLSNNTFICSPQQSFTAPVEISNPSLSLTIDFRTNPTVDCSIPPPCENGTFSPYPPLIQCQECPEGTYAPFPNSQHCEPCMEGYVRTPNVRFCEICPAGSSWTVKSPWCKQCRKPYYKENPGVGLCDQVCAEEDEWSPSACLKQLKIEPVEEDKNQFQVALGGAVAFVVLLISLYFWW